MCLHRQLSVFQEQTSCTLNTGIICLRSVVTGMLWVLFFSSPKDTESVILKAIRSKRKNEVRVCCSSRTLLICVILKADKRDHIKTRCARAWLWLCSLF